MERFPFATDVRVRFAETDAQGIAHHSVYLVWFELARVDYLARFARGYRALQAEGIEAVVVDAAIRFGLPARFDDVLTIHASCRELRGARFSFVYHVERAGDTIADGRTGHACVNASTLRPTRVPRWLAEAIATAEAAA